MHNRLHHLESLVINMMNDQKSMLESSASSNLPPSSLGNLVAQCAPSANLEGPSQGPNRRDSLIQREIGTPPVGSASGQVVLGTIGTNYIGATHWAAILEDVREPSS